MAAQTPATPPGADKAVAVRHLSVSFGAMRAVDDLSFTLPRGRITGLIGPNGAGKSTALRLISGWIRPDHGEVTLDGRVITGRPAHVLARQGLTRTFQISSEFPRLTVLENLLVAVPGQRGDSFAGTLPGRWRWRREERAHVEVAMDLLRRFGMAAKADDYAGELSGGQKRLVEIMRALMTRPKVLLLDEPLAGVNPTLCRDIEEHLRALRDDGLTLLMVEHELGAVERVCDSVIVMAGGRVLAEGDMQALRGNQEVVDAYLVG